MEYFEDNIMGKYGSMNVGDTHYEAFKQRAFLFPPYPFNPAREMSWINGLSVDKDSRGHLLAPTRKQIEDQKKK